MDRDFGGGEGWQAAMTTEWLRRLATESCRVAVLDGQTRPTFVRAAEGAVVPRVPVHVGLPVIDTSALEIAEVADRIAELCLPGR